MNLLLGLNVLPQHRFDDHVPGFFVVGCAHSAQKFLSFDGIDDSFRGDTHDGARGRSAVDDIFLTEDLSFAYLGEPYFLKFVWVWFQRRFVKTGLTLFLIIS